MGKKTVLCAVQARCPGLELASLLPLRLSSAPSPSLSHRASQHAWSPLVRAVLLTERPRHCPLGTDFFKALRLRRRRSGKRMLPALMSDLCYSVCLSRNSCSRQKPTSCQDGPSICHETQNGSSTSDAAGGWKCRKRCAPRREQQERRPQHYL